MPSIPFGGEFYLDDSRPVSAQECVNLYTSIPETISTTKRLLRHSPGVTEEDDGSTKQYNGDVCRGGILYDKFPGAAGTRPSAFLVYGSRAAEVDFVGETIDIGTSSSVISGAGTVVMAVGGDDLIVVDPGSSSQFNAFINAGFASLTAISDADFDGPVSCVTFSDGYFVFTKSDSRTFFCSNLLDGTAYDSTDTAEYEVELGNTVGCFALGDIVYIFGKENFVPYQNIGGSGFPFQKIPGGTQRVGLVAPTAITGLAGLMFFCGKESGGNISVWLSDGGQPQRVSKSPIDQELASFTEDQLSVIHVWSYSVDDETFGVVATPTKTFEYCVSSASWATRESISPTNGDTVPWRVNAVIKVGNKSIVGDSLSSSIGTLSSTVYQEFGQTIRRRFVTPHLDNDGEPFFIDSLELVCESGVSGNDDAYVSMSKSIDGGFTFNDPVERAIGKTGEYTKRLIWNSLGRISREVCFKFETSAAIRFLVRKLEARFE